MLRQRDVRAVRHHGDEPQPEGRAMIRKSLLRKPGEPLVCYCPPGVCQAPRGFRGPCRRASDVQGEAEYASWQARAALPVPAASTEPVQLTEDAVLRAIQSCGSEVQGRIKLTFDSGPYEVTRPTLVAMKLAHAIQRQCATPPSPHPSGELVEAARKGLEALESCRIRAVSEWEVREVTPKFITEAIAALRSALEKK